MVSNISLEELNGLLLSKNLVLRDFAYVYLKSKRERKRFFKFYKIISFPKGKIILRMKQPKFFGKFMKKSKIKVKILRDTIPIFLNKNIFCCVKDMRYKRKCINCGSLIISNDYIRCPICDYN